MSLKEEISKYRQEIKSERMDMSFGEIINMYKEKEIVISPEYQRAFRWDEQRQTDFIESILLGIPFPSIFVATNEDGTWELIDGLQRVSTVLSFFGELKSNEGNENPKNHLVLQEGGLIKGLKGLNYDSLPVEYRLQIKRTPCRVEIILKESDFNMRYELFKRLNTGGEGLSRQEIRNCIFRGIDTKYSDFISELASNEIFREIVKINERKSEMMYYDELILRYLSLKNKLTEYNEDNIQDFMDNYLKKQCLNFDEDKVKKDRKTFCQIMTTLKPIKDKRIFTIGNQQFSTSMYDAIMLSIAEAVEKNIDIDVNDFVRKIDSLRENKEFHRYVGSASSKRNSIVKKLDVAKKIFLK